ncbi:type II secretion system protein M [Marinobacter lipolyticus]|uniref:type II secretion system protein GspM n=1 Tax=Marinobacter lipolyticus TaxID=209639 RepID=UPI001BCAAD6E|nr:type II secretion system protein M [Marinobacter lipolyticus]MBS8239195.1 type II secretion system protein M [Marinobacter lipolyticus]
MLTKLKEQPAVEKLIAQYDQLPRRDQQALTVLAVAVFLGLLYFVIWRPVAGYHEQAVSARENAEELLSWMQANEASLERLSEREGGGGPAANAPEDGRALMALVTRSAGESGLSLQRFEPSGSDAIRVWLEDVSFAEVAAWLENLTANHGVVIDQAALDKQDEPGIVSVRLTLTI